MTKVQDVAAHSKVKSGKDHFLLTRNCLTAHFNNHDVLKCSVATIADPTAYRKALMGGRQSRGLLSEDKRYTTWVIPTNKEFIGCCFGSRVMEDPSAIQASPFGEIAKTHGLKFHLSLPEWDVKKFNEGWDIVRNTLMKYGVVSFKLIRPELTMYSDSDVGQAGKQITIYANENPEFTLAQWQNILQEITQKLVVAGIPPGYRPPFIKPEGAPKGSKPEIAIEGCNYCSYRYYDEKHDKVNWPAGDPCSTIRVNVFGQQPIPILPTKNIHLGPETAATLEKLDIDPKKLSL